MSDTGWQGFGTAVVKDQVLAALLVRAPLTNPGLEGQLTGLRRRLLLDGASPAALPALKHLAIQGFINEYAWAVDDIEAARVDVLRDEIARGRRDAAGLLTLAAYESLAALPDAASLRPLDVPDLVAPVLKQQVADVLKERELAAAIATLTPLHDAVSASVRAQYEANPYPRWVAAPAPPARTGDAAIDILVAGCGAGRSAIEQAMKNPAARVLAVDISRASLAYAERMADELGVGNIAFGQADVLELGGLGRSFDLIECSGVLHHLADPFAGATALASALKPGGTLFLGVYSATARRVLAPAKALAAGFRPTTDGVRALRRAIQAAAPGDPVRQVIDIGDFYATSTCRDLLMHVQEVEMDIADIRRILDENRLEFLGFTVPQAVSAAYATIFPGDPGARDLSRWAEFERRNPATFTGMYQFVARKPA